MVTQIEKDIKATIRLLRFLTHGEGYASISVFDAGAGGGFERHPGAAGAGAAAGRARAGDGRAARARDRRARRL